MSRKGWVTGRMRILGPGRVPIWQAADQHVRIAQATTSAAAHLTGARAAWSSDGDVLKGAPYPLTGVHVDHLEHNSNPVALCQVVVAVSEILPGPDGAET